MTLDPHKAGFVDGLFNRACESEWKTWKDNQKYLKGYMEGQKANEKNVHRNTARNNDAMREAKTEPFAFV